MGLTTNTMDVLYLAECLHNQWMDWAKTIIKSEKISDERIKRWKKECFKPFQNLDYDIAKKDIELAIKILRFD